MNVDPKMPTSIISQIGFDSVKTSIFMLDFDDQIQPQEFQAEDTIRPIHSDWVTVTSVEMPGTANI